MPPRATDAPARYRPPLHPASGRARVTHVDGHNSENLLRKGGGRDGVSTGIPGPLRCGCGGLDGAGRRRLGDGEGRHPGRGVRPRPAGRAGGVRHGAGQIRRRLVCRHPHQSLSRSGGRPAGPGRPRTGKPVEVPSVSDDGSFGFGLRVLADGAWGFSASYEVTREAIARAAAEAVEIARANASLRRRPIELAATPSYRDTYRTKVVTDPFSVPIEQKLELLRAAAAKARAVAGVFSVMGQDRRPARGPILRLDRGERHRAAHLPDRARDHRDGRRGRPQGQVAVLPAALRLRRLRGGRAGRHGRPRPPDRRGGRRAPEGALGLARASRTSSCCRRTCR